MHVAFLTYYQSVQVFLALTISSHKNRNIFALLAGLEYVVVNLSLIITERSIKILQSKHKYPKKYGASRSGNRGR